VEGGLSTNQGLFDPLVMFFGLTNSPATFKMMMNDIFPELINEGVVVIYRTTSSSLAARQRRNTMPL